MTDLKRDEIKYVRDLSKSSYNKDTKCFICGAEENLQFHHFFSLTQLWNKWKKDNKIKISSEEDMLHYREIFKGEFYKEIYEDTVTLCEHHHMGVLHKIYGKMPPLHTGEKQRRWCIRMRDKHNAKTTA